MIKMKPKNRPKSICKFCKKESVILKIGEETIKEPITEEMEINKTEHILTLIDKEYSALKDLFKEILDFADTNISPPPKTIQEWSNIAYNLGRSLE